MKNLTIFFLIYFVLSYIKSQRNDYDFSDLYDKAKDILNEIYYNNREDLNKVGDCMKILLEKVNENSETFVKNLVQSSSRTFNDISSYIDCKGSDTKNESIYFVLEVSPNKENITTSEELWYFFGLCFFNGKTCTYKNYKNITETYVKEALNLTESKIELLKLEPDKNWIFLRLLPALVIILNIIFVNLPLPFCLYKCCFKNKKKEDEKIENNRDVNDSLINKDDGNNDDYGINREYDVKGFDDFKETSKISSGFEELFSLKEKSQFNDDTGLIYIKGIRGFSMIFLCFGCAFIDIFNSPNYYYSKDSISDFLRNPFYFIFSIGSRYSPRVLLSCSGFILSLKLLSFLDENVEEVDNEPDKNVPFSEDSIDISREKISHKRNEGKVKWKFLFKFYFYQTHKYLLFLFLFFFMQFSVYIIYFIFGLGPNWLYFGEKVIGMKSWGRMISYLTFGLFFYPSQDDEEHFFNYLWLIPTEIVFFIFTSFIIFIGYKKNYKIHYILICPLIALTIIGKIITFFVPLELARHGSFYYILYDFGKWFMHPTFNYIYYLIGVGFGLMNYVTQKKIDFQYIDGNEKDLLYDIILIVEKIKNLKEKYVKISNFVMTLFILLLIIASVLIMKEDIEKLSENIWRNFFYLLDIEFVVFLTHCIFFTSYIKGNSFIIGIFSSTVWFFTNKIYFLFILLINPVFLCCMAITETAIDLNVFNCFLFSLVCGFITLCLSVLFYITLELPLKRIIKLIGKSVNKYQ